MPMYREVEVATIPSHTKQAAEVALKHGCVVLGFLLPPELRWCTPVTDSAEVKRLVALTPRGELAPPGYRFSLVAFNGLVDGTHFVFWLRAGMSSKETAITVMHELGHLSHRLNGQPNSDWGSAVRAREEEVVEAFAQSHWQTISSLLCHL